MVCTDCLNRSDVSLCHAIAVAATLYRHRVGLVVQDVQDKEQGHIGLNTVLSTYGLLTTSSVPKLMLKGTVSTHQLKPIGDE